ncbi:MAG: hypothetical protein ABF975_01330 [Liquorilactobacillus hordei]|uniref:hypothetical protein n=1 Tax=Liquorilactobacillus hordei TaxID=468911 RepID=UPI0039EADDB1
MTKTKLVLGQTPYPNKEKLDKIPDFYPFSQVAFIPKCNPKYETFMKVLEIIGEQSITINPYNGIKLAKKFESNNIFFANRSEIIKSGNGQRLDVSYPELKSFLDKNSSKSIHVYIIGKCSEDYALFELLNKYTEVTYSLHYHPRNHGNIYHLIE